jgi:hypothetical protein
MSSTSGYILKTIVSRKQMLFFTITFFSTVLLFLYSYEFITKIAFCVRHHSSPYNWYTYYKVPDPDPARIAHGVKGILNLCDEELNFALYGPYFNKSVITSQEIQNTIYGDNLLYTDRMHLPPYTSEQIDMFSKRFNGFYIFSDNDIRHSKLKLITSSSVQFPEMEWLKRYIYILGDNHSVQ